MQGEIILSQKNSVKIENGIIKIKLFKKTLGMWKILSSDIYNTAKCLEWTDKSSESDSNCYEDTTKMEINRAFFKMLTNAK